MEKVNYCKRVQVQLANRSLEQFLNREPTETPQRAKINKYYSGVWLKLHEVSTSNEIKSMPACSLHGKGQLLQESSGSTCQSQSGAILKQRANRDPIQEQKEIPVHQDP